MPSDVHFSLVKRLLESHGWRLVRISGSHHYFVRPNAEPISVPVHHGHEKAVYVRKAKKLIEQYGHAD